MKKKIIFIINPISGTSRTKNVKKTIETILDKDKFEYEILFTKYRGHAELLAREASKSQIPYIVSVGGDGTLNEIVNGMQGYDSVLGIVATGSGNGLARHLKISTDPLKAVKIINKENIQKIDTVSINNKHFVSIAGVGFDALVARRFARYGKRGFFSYLKTTLKSFISYKPKKYQILIDGEKLIKDSFFITFANSSQWGYNTIIAPEASLTDGLIDVCIFKKPSLLNAILLIPYLFTNRINKSKQMEIIKAKEILITRTKNKKMHIHIDGEDSKKTKKIFVKIEPLSLRVLIP